MLWNVTIFQISRRVMQSRDGFVMICRCHDHHPSGVVMVLGILRILEVIMVLGSLMAPFYVGAVAQWPCLMLLYTRTYSTVLVLYSTLLLTDKLRTTY
jgi:hypothetical protein